MAVIRISASRVMPIARETAYDRTIAVELPQLFARRYRIFPSVVSTYAQDEKWGREVGQTRVVRTSRGGAVTETLVAMDRPFRFSYRVEAFHGTGRRVIRSIDGSWTFAPAETDAGTEVTWAWEITPVSRAAVPVAALAGRLWTGYAQHTLTALQSLLVTS